MSISNAERDEPGAEPAAFDIKSEALVMLGAVVNRLAAGAAPTLRSFLDLSLNESRLVWFLGEGAIGTAAEAARMIAIDGAAISRSVQRLVDRGLVVATPDPQHAKRNALNLTRQGRIFADAVSRFNKERQERLLSVLSADERAAFLDALSRIMDNIEATNTVKPDEAWLAG